MSRRDSTSTRMERFNGHLPSEDIRRGGPGTSVRKLEQKVDSLSRAVHTLHKKLDERHAAQVPGELRDYLNQKKSMSQVLTKKGLKRLWKTVFGPKTGITSQPEEREDHLSARAGGGKRRASALMKTQGQSRRNKSERIVLGGEGPSGPPAPIESLTNILRQIREEEFLRWPKAPKNPGGGDPWEYCHYHCCHGHDTEDCRMLQAEIERLVNEGYLDHSL